MLLILLMLNGPFSVFSCPGELLFASNFWRFFDINKEIARFSL